MSPVIIQDESGPMVECPQCEGFGNWLDWEPGYGYRENHCTDCNGSGLVPYVAEKSAETTVEAALATADDIFNELSEHERGRCASGSVDACVRRIRCKIGTYRSLRAKPKLAKSEPPPPAKEGAGR
jgi:hypothetical protein